MASASKAPGWSSSGKRGRFWLYFAGQTISNLGSAFTTFALPLLVYRLTGSASDLGASAALTYLPWVLFGLLGGALMDRVDRRRAMIVADVSRACVIAVLPIVSLLGHLELTWIYAVMFVQSSLQIPFLSGEFTAVAALVKPDDLSVANGRISASYSAGTVLGGAAAGLLVGFIPLVDVLWIDSASFALSAISLAAIGSSFNVERPVGLRGVALRQLVVALAADTRVGLRYVWNDPLLRTLSTLLPVVNLFGSVFTAQLPLFAARRLDASSSEIGFLYAAASTGVVVVSLVVSAISRRFSAATLVIAALIIYGTGITAFGLTTSYPAGVVLEGCIGGATVLLNVTATTLRQRLVPNGLLGRVMNVSLVFAWSAIPIGSFAGGAIITATGHIQYDFAAVGIVIVLAALVARAPLLASRTQPDGESPRPTSPSN